MSVEMNRQSIADLKRQVDRICDGQGSFLDVSQPRDFRAFTPAPADVRLVLPADPTKGPFGQWLVAQEASTEGMFLLIACAKRDPHFPMTGDPEAVRARLRACMAEGDLFAALDDAELDWLAL